MIVAVSAVEMPGVSPAVGGIEVRSSEEEVVTMGVAGIDAEVPVTSLPVEGTVEVGSCHKGVPLPRIEDIAQVEVAALPVDAKDVVDAGHSHQVVEVNLVGGLVLCISQIQLVSHLIGQEQRLVTGLLVAHCTCRHSCGQHHHQCEKYLLHNRRVFTV